jgi:hypothetical protein
MAIWRRGKKHPQRRPRTNAIPLAQMMTCPNLIMSAAHWMDVEPDGHCRCYVEMDMPHGIGGDHADAG